MKKYIVGGILFFSLIFLSFRYAYLSELKQMPSDECSTENNAFFSGEELTYQALYNWGFIWLEAGEVTFKIQKDEHKGIPCYKISGIGGSYPSYDWIYKVRDRFECWVDTVTLKPYRYIRDVNEGGRTFYNECFFNYTKMKVYCVTKEHKKLPRLDTVSIGACSFDPLTMIYYSRIIDYKKYKVNDTIPISLFLDSEVFSLYLRYLGKTTLKVDDKREFNCVKFSPKLVEGTIFRGGEGMIVWATDDENRIPLFVEAPILVGSIKAKIIKWKGLRNPLSSKK